MNYILFGWMIYVLYIVGTTYVELVQEGRPPFTYAAGALIAYGILGVVPVLLVKLTWYIAIWRN